jgi:Phasin protein
LKLVLELHVKRWTEEPLQRSRRRGGPRSYSSTAEGVREFNAKLLDIAQANTMAGMNFVSELTRGPTEAFELWSRHAQSYLQRLSEQSQELAALGQRIASSSAEPLTRGFDQTFKRAS